MDLHCRFQHHFVLVEDPLEVQGFRQVVLLEELRHFHLEVGCHLQVVEVRWPSQLVVRRAL